MKTCSYAIVLAIILWIDLDLRILHLVILGYDVNEDLILNLRASLLRDNDLSLIHIWATRPTMQTATRLPAMMP